MRSTRPVTYPGDVWSFTTEDYGVVEDFESYTDDEGNRIYDAWIDGSDRRQERLAGRLRSTAPFAETTIIHGGKQSMPLNYDNTAKLSFAKPC